MSIMRRLVSAILVWQKHIMASRLGEEVAVGLLAGPEEFKRVREAGRTGYMARLWRGLTEHVETDASREPDSARRGPPLSDVACVYFNDDAWANPADMLHAAEAALALNSEPLRFVLQSKRPLPTGLEDLYKGRDNVKVVVDSNAFRPGRRMDGNAVAAAGYIRGFAGATLYLPPDYEMEGARPGWTISSVSTLSEFFRNWSELNRLVDEQA